jgi:hypothetical protein
MTPEQKIIGNRLGLLELPDQLGNVSQGLQYPRVLRNSLASRRISIDGGR